MLCTICPILYVLYKWFSIGDQRNHFGSIDTFSKIANILFDYGVSKFSIFNKKKVYENLILYYV